MVEGCIFMQPMFICLFFFGKVFKFYEGIVSYATKCEAPRFCCDSYQVALWQPTLGGAPEANCLARFVFLVFLCFCLHYCLYFVYLRWECRQFYQMAAQVFLHLFPKSTSISQFKYHCHLHQDKRRNFERIFTFGQISYRIHAKRQSVVQYDLILNFARTKITEFREMSDKLWHLVRSLILSNPRGGQVSNLKDNRPNYWH